MESTSSAAHPDRVNLDEVEARCLHPDCFHGQCHGIAGWEDQRWHCQGEANRRHQCSLPEEQQGRAPAQPEASDVRGDPREAQGQVP